MMKRVDLRGNNGYCIQVSLDSYGERFNKPCIAQFPNNTTNHSKYSKRSTKTPKILNVDAPWEVQSLDVSCHNTISKVVAAATARQQILPGNHPRVASAIKSASTVLRIYGSPIPLNLPTELSTRQKPLEDWGRARYCPQ